MANKEKILVDIDETSARTLEDGVYPVVNAAYRTDFRFDDTRDYRDVFADRLYENGEPMPLQRKIEVFNAAIRLDRGKNLIRPVDGSVEKILELSTDFDFGMLTARHPMLMEYAPEWVAHHYGSTVGQVLFSNCFHGGKRRKPDICKEEWAKTMVEDDMDYAVELAREGIRVFLLKKPWNEYRKEKHGNILRIDSWADFRP